MESSVLEARPRIRWRGVLCFLLAIEVLTYGKPFFMIAAVVCFALWLMVGYLETWAWNHLNGGAPWQK